MRTRQRKLLFRAVAILVMSLLAAVAAGLAASDYLIIAVVIAGAFAETALGILPLYRESRSATQHSRT